MVKNKREVLQLFNLHLSQ